MPKCVKFVDVVSLQAISTLEEKDITNLTDWMVSNPTENSVTVKLKATHAARITLNNSMYLPDKVRSGVGSWMSPFAKPILLHHPEKSSLFGTSASGKDRDPVGRVIEARYVDISHQVPRVDSLKDDHNYDQFKKLARGEYSFEDACAIATMLLVDSDELMSDPTYEGLGYIELTASISDPDAVRKVLDGRYLTGSISASTNKAICSVCKSDWANDEELCEHRPGKTYEGKRCVLIAGDLSYSEYSFVNSPADVYSGVIEVQNSVEPKYFVPNQSVIPGDQASEGPFTFQEATGFFNKKHSIFDLVVEKSNNHIEREEDSMSKPVDAKTPEVLEGPPVAPTEVQDKVEPEPVVDAQPEVTPEVEVVPEVITDDVVPEVVPEPVVDSQTEVSILDKIRTLVENVPVKADFDSLKDEIQGLQDDNLMLQEALTNALSELKDTRRSHLALLTCISTKNPKIKEVSEGLAEKTIDEVNEDLKKIEDMLQDDFLCDILSPNGLANPEPEGAVADPTLNVADSPQRSEILQKKKMQAIIDKAKEIEVFNGHQAAVEFLQLHLGKLTQLSDKEE